MSETHSPGAVEICLTVDDSCPTGTGLDAVFAPGLLLEARSAKAVEDFVTIAYACSGGLASRLFGTADSAPNPKATLRRRTAKVISAGTPFSSNHGVLVAKR